MKTLLLVRHGATEWSEAGRLCGWSDVPLNAAGRAQATALREQLAEIQPDGVWTSDLKRAAETASLAGLDAHAAADLRELNFGELEGVVWDQLGDDVRSTMISFHDFAAPGGESVPQLKQRVVRFLDDLDDGHHVLFTHGGVIRLLGSLCGKDRRLLAPCETVTLEWLPEISSGG
ncbi:MAG TPA: histidine phosphatase family protein [Actinomycetota bacterium]|nr:histidine phosphatase family protein [Actinomycetota bacterium]